MLNNFLPNPPAADTKSHKGQPIHLMKLRDQDFVGNEQLNFFTDIAGLVLSPTGADNDELVYFIGKTEDTAR